MEPPATSQIHATNTTRDGTDSSYTGQLAFRLDFHGRDPWRRRPAPTATTQTPTNKPLPYSRLHFHGRERWRPLPQAKSTLQSPPETTQTAQTQVNWAFRRHFHDRDPGDDGQHLQRPPRPRQTSLCSTLAFISTAESGGDRYHKQNPRKITARHRTDSSNTGILGFSPSFPR